VKDILGYLFASCGGTPVCRLSKAYRPGLSAAGSPSGRTPTVALGAAVGVGAGVADGPAVGLAAAVGSDVGASAIPTLLADAPQPVQASAIATTVVATKNDLPSVFM
jgi:hypothetical protein